jgi:hypothetical protein
VEEAAEEGGVRCVTKLCQQAFLRPWRRRRRRKWRRRRRSD